MYNILIIDERQKYSCEVTNLANMSSFIIKNVFEKMYKYFIICKIGQFSGSINLPVNF